MTSPILVDELEVGDTFKKSNRHRNLIRVTQIIDFDTHHSKHSDPELFAMRYQNRMLLLDGCRQFKAFKDETVVLVSSPRKEVASV